jgi:hypothetical protein
MEAQDHDYPDEFLDAIESFIRDGVDEHPNPKNARRNSESPDENDEQQSKQSRYHMIPFV